MKIFDWVQRTLIPNQLLKDDGFGRGVKKEGPCLSAAAISIEEVDGPLGSWKDGILTIGTFGYDPLITQQQQEEDTDHLGLIPYSGGDEYGCPVNNDNGILTGWVAEEEHISNIIEYGDNDDDEELNPLILSEQSYVQKDHQPLQGVEKAANIIGEEANIVRSRSSSRSRSSRATPNSKRDIITKGERTTLADLFSADSADRDAKSREAINASGKKKQINKEKKKFELAVAEEEEEAPDKVKKAHAAAHSFSKKFISHMSHGSRPIKKLNKMMRKMLKRKVHPELERTCGGEDDDGNATLKLQAMEDDGDDEAAASDHDQPSRLPNFHPIKDDGAADDSVSLLLTNANPDVSL